MKLAILTKSTFFVEEDKILATLFEEGLDNLHLYKPDCSPMFAERLLTLLPREHYSKITVHDHFYLKNEYNLAGIHIDSHSEQIPTGYRGKIGYTCTDISRLKEMKKKANVVFLKNIFDCIEFKDKKATFSIRKLQKASSQGLIDKKVFALGGISLENAKIAKELGFGGVVVCGDLWNKFNIHNQMDYKDVILHFQKLKKAIT